MLKVRQPNLDFEQCLPHWSPNLEFAQYNNAISISPCALEPFMIKVFQKAKERLDPVRDAELIREVNWFNAQEAQHYKIHARFNKCFQTERYPQIVEIEREFRDDLEDFFANRSLEFCLAYSEGFESSGSIWYKVWFEEMDEYRVGARPEALALFDWHYAEEYEHREVAYKLYMAIAARGNLWRWFYYGWLYRCWGAVFTMQHIHKFTARARAHLFDVDRAEMTPAEREASIAREQSLGAHIAQKMKWGMLSLLSPFHNPAHKAPPRGYSETMSQFEPGGQYGRISKEIG